MKPLYYNDKNKDTIYLLELYGLYEFFCVDNELYESNADWDFIKQNGRVIASGIVKVLKKIIKSQNKKALAQVKMLANKTRERIKFTDTDSLSALKDFFFATLMLVAGLYGNGCCEEYNDKPLFKNTSIEPTAHEFVVKDNGKTKIYPNPNSGIDFENGSPIILKGNGIPRPTSYSPSKEMLQSIKDAEYFVPYAYSSNDTTHKPLKSQKELMTKPDITIGYGHKLTDEEKKNWNFNKHISKAEAERLFQADVNKHMESVNNHLHDLWYYNDVIFSQGFIDGLFSLRFNCSSLLTFGRPDWYPTNIDTFWESMNKLRKDKTTQTMRKDDYVCAISKVKNMYRAKFEKGKKMSGLNTRREFEMDIMLQPFGKVNPGLYDFTYDNPTPECFE